MLFLPRVRSLSGIVSFGKLSSVIAGVFSSLLLAMCHHGNPWLTELHEFDNDAGIVIERRHDTFEINLEVFGLELFILRDRCSACRREIQSLQSRNCRVADAV